MVASASEEASINVQSVASATEELSSSVTEIARQVQESSKIAAEAVRQAEHTDERINALSQAAGRIGDHHHFADFEISTSIASAVEEQALSREVSGHIDRRNLKHCHILSST